MSDVEVTEGAVTIRVPGVSGKDKGPGKREASVFYNPAMTLNRDVSVLALAELAQPNWEVLEGLAASGIRGLRYAKEVPDLRVVLNDWNPVAATRIAENAKANGLHVEVTNRNLGALLWERAFHWIDIDPFGSPSTFTDAACRALRNRGVLALTATDAGALAGSYPAPCRRRYLANPLRGELQHELGLRILAGHAVRTAAKHETALEPVLAHATDYYYRVFVQGRQGAGRTDAALENIGHAWLCPACGARGFARTPARACDACAATNVQNAGPLWTGPLGRRDTLAGMARRLESHPVERKAEAAALIARLVEEADAPPLFINVHRHCRLAKAPAVPRNDALAAALRDAGYQAVPTHLDPVGLRTDAPAAEVQRLIRELVGA